MDDELRDLTLQDFERQISQLQASIRDLCESAIRLDEMARLPGAAVRKWLMDRGFSDEDATRAIVAVLDERRASRGAPPVGTCSRR